MTIVTTIITKTPGVLH